MARYETHKRTSQGKARTIARNTARALKYQQPARLTTAGRAGR